MLLAEQGGVCGMIKTTCCTFIPNNTAPDGSVARVLAGLQSLRLELAESSGINDPFTEWMESPMSDGCYRCSRCHPSLPGDRVYTGEFGRGTTRGARPDLAGEHRIDLLHHCPRAPTPCSAPIHEDPLIIFVVLTFNACWKCRTLRHIYLELFVVILILILFMVTPICMPSWIYLLIYYLIIDFLLLCYLLFG